MKVLRMLRGEEYSEITDFRMNVNQSVLLDKWLDRFKRIDSSWRSLTFLHPISSIDVEIVTSNLLR